MSHYYSLRQRSFSCWELVYEIIDYYCLQLFFTFAFSLSFSVFLFFIVTYVGRLKIDIGLISFRLSVSYSIFNK